MSQTPFYEVNQAVTEAGGIDLNLCMQCGFCASLCPWREVDGEFSIRKMIRQGQLGIEGYESEEILFGCTTCGRCAVQCPRGVDVLGIVRSMRSMVVGMGSMPRPVKAALGSCQSNGNPWSEPREKRSEWAKGLDVPVFDAATTEYFLFVCCTSCYDARSRQIARSVVDVLRKAGVSFGILGNEESCCGESVRKVGDEEGFQKLARANTELFRSRGVKKIITTSPHCLYTFSREYPEFGGEYEVVHYTRLLSSLLDEGRLKAAEVAPGKIAYHDPCYLGRHAGSFEDPRRLLAATGAQPIPLEREERHSLCCGGGGGRIWMETPQEQRFSVLRVREAADAGAEVLATACPYCVSLLEDSCKTSGLEGRLRVMDIAEILSRGVG